MIYLDTLSLYGYTLYYIGILLYTYICIYAWSVINHNDVNPTIKNPEFSVNEMGNPPLFGQMTPQICGSSWRRKGRHEPKIYKI